MKWTLGLGGLLIVAVLGMMVLGHNPMQHLMARFTRARVALKEARAQSRRARNETGTLHALDVAPQPAQILHAIMH